MSEKKAMKLIVFGATGQTGAAVLQLSTQDPGKTIPFFLVECTKVVAKNNYFHAKVVPEMVLLF